MRLSANTAIGLTKQITKIKCCFLAADQHWKWFDFVGILLALSFFLLYNKPFAKLGKEGLRL